MHRYLEYPEVRVLLEDLCERRRGHRNVTDEEVEHALALMDTDGNGEVDVYEFTKFIRQRVNVVGFGGESGESVLPLGGLGMAPPKAKRISRKAEEFLSGAVR